MERDGMEQLLLEQIVVVVVVVVNVIDVVVSKINRTSLSLEDYEGKSNDVVVGRLRIDRTMLLLLDADYGTEWNGTMLLLLRCWKKTNRTTVERCCFFVVGSKLKYGRTIRYFGVGSELIVVVASLSEIGTMLLLLLSEAN